MASCYLKIIERKANGFEEGDAAIQLFRSACSYSKTVAEEIGQGPDQEAASLNLFLAAEAMEKGDQELSNAYENYAASNHHLAIARNPTLLEHFPPRFQAGFKKKSVLNLSLIKYWENAVDANQLKIEKLFKERRQTRHNVVATTPNQASAGII